MRLPAARAFRVPVALASWSSSSGRRPSRFPFPPFDMTSSLHDARFLQGPTAMRSIASSRSRGLGKRGDFSPARPVCLERDAAVRGRAPFGPTEPRVPPLYLARRGARRPCSGARVAAAARPHHDALSGLAGPRGSSRRRPASTDYRFGTRFEDATHYTTLLLGDFTGRDVKRVIRRAIAESLLRRDAPDTAGWPRE